jgi:hypothetical protein
MFEAGENVAFPRDAFADAPVHQAQVWQLQRHLALDGAVDLFRQPHRRRAAVAKFAQQPVRPHHRVGVEGQRLGHRTETG